MIRALSFLKPTKYNWLRKLISVIAEVYAAMLIVKQVETVDITKEIMQILITVLIALIAVVFTGYAIFQALMNDKLLIILLSVNKKNKAGLSETNNYFAELMELQILCLLMNVIAFIATVIMPDQWYLFSNHVVNEVLATCFISLILYFNSECIFEMQSFVFNVFQLFNLYAYSRVKELQKGEQECREDKNQT